MNNHCEGCITLKDPYGKGISCYWYSYNKDGSCPCTNCLIKMICDLFCDNFGKWTEKMEPPMDEEHFAEWEAQQEAILKDEINDP